LNRLAVNGHDAAELSTADMESYVVARKHVESTGLPVHVCAELFAQAHAKLGGRSLADAVEFFLEFNRAEHAAKSLRDLIADFATGRATMDVHSDYIRISNGLSRPAVAQLRTANLDGWLSVQPWQPLTKNDARKICIIFGNWAKTRGYLPLNRPTEFEGMVTYKVPTTKVAIYTPAALQTLLAAVQTNLPDLLPWAACAAFTDARVAELAMLRWESINFDRGFVEVASNKVRTKARRLVPLHDALRAWLEPRRQKAGLITDYVDPRARARAVAGAKVTLQDNGFRHSYISYRVAQINDTARVALECGNSPEVIFQHYRELVGPDEAAAWFAASPGAPIAAPTPQPAELPAPLATAA
jgi:integrase